jgi:nitrilase
VKKKIITAGVVQATPALFDLNTCIERTIRWMKEAADAGCDLVLFPETFIPGYPRGLSFDAKVGRRSEKSQQLWLRYWNNSLQVGSSEFREIASVISELKLFVGLGITEKDEKSGTLYCTLLYFDNNGELVGRHRKIKPTGLERYLWGEGNAGDLISVTSSFGRIGGLICWENYMPLARMAMYEQGVEIYLAPTADARESWQSTMQHIAREGRCFVLSSNQFFSRADLPEDISLPDEPKIMSAGGSVIYDPFGNVLAGPLWNKEGLLIAELDMDLLIKSKLEFDAVGHYNRKDIFRFEVKSDSKQRKNIEE